MNFNYSIKYEDLPNISILMPIYNRRNWLFLIINNLVNMDYPKNKLEFIFDDDGTEKTFENEVERMNFENITGIKTIYLYNKNKRTIGQKRNNLVKKANNKLCIFMDSDDLYIPSYIRYSYEVMVKEKASLVGSNQMIFLFPKKKWKLTAIQCPAKRQIHEATMLFTKKHFRAMGGFINNSQGEGAKMIDSMKDCKIAETDCAFCMVCIGHDDNTINKDNFADIEDLTHYSKIPDKEKKFILMGMGLVHNFDNVDDDLLT